MVKSEKGKQKSDYFTNVMITQAVVCLIIIVLMIFSVKSDGKFAQTMKNEYEKLMVNDFSSEDAADAFRTFREYAAVFSQKTSDSAESASETEYGKQEETQSFVGGGADIEFTSLDALEGVCFEKYTVDFPYGQPLKQYDVTSSFGYRTSPISGKTGVHTGIDLAAGYGSSIYAFAEGTVADAAYDNSYGYYVKLLHEDNFVTIYAHCSSLCVEAGDKVETGEKIALVGSTGDSTGNHLHFEMRKDNIRIDPKYVLFADDN